ncbi:transmembrane sensor/regulator PpyR [Pseudomonas sp. NPDC089534]|uniref:transmembrane sensor/regulator PpyR n=1 Tax=Pseudomonas sp. NPDC089534 TaxID=3364468 RepID=UPI003821BEE2
MLAFFESPLNVLHLSSRVLVAGLALLSVGLYGAYLHQGHLPLGLLVTMHTLTVIGPTLLKIGYVMRLVAERRLGLVQMPARACHA